MSIRSLTLTFTLMILGIAACDDSGGAPVSQSDASEDVAADVGSELDGSDADIHRFTVSPVTMNAFGHQPATVTDADCLWPTAPSVTVQGIPAVLATVGDGGCELTFEVQGGQPGPALIEVLDGEESVATVDGLEYEPTLGEGMFERSIVIGDSLGAEMVSWYMSYDAQVNDGLFAFYFRQISAYCPPPLVRRERVPRIITLADFDPVQGIIPQTTLLTPEMLEFFLGDRPLSDVRLNSDTVACNQSIPGMHDVTWVERPLVFEPSEIMGLYEALLRFPYGIPDEPPTIMDAVAEADPTFVIVSPGALAYALDGNYVSDDVLEDDIEHFLRTLAELPSSPRVLLASMPDTSSVPFHEFNYAERYYTLRVNNQLYSAVERINSELDEVRFGVSPLGERHFAWFEGPDQVSFGDVDYDAYVDDEGWPHIEIQDDDGETFSDPIPAVDVSAVISRDPETEVALRQDAVDLGLGDLSTFRGPPPPVLTTVERCAITGGPFASEPGTACPADLRATVDGEPCNDATPTWPLTITVTVTDEADQPMAGAPIGLSTMPAEEHGLIAYLRGGVTDEEGRLTITVEEDSAASASGDSLLIQAGSVDLLCPKP